MTDSRQPDELAARLDKVLPPGSADIDESTAAGPAIQAAVRLAHDPRPALSAESRARIEAQILAHAAGARRPVVTRVIGWGRWAAAACLMVAVLAAVLVFSSSGGPSHPAAPTVDQAQFSVPDGLYAPSSPDTVVYIPQDTISPVIPLTEIGAGSTSIFIVPETP
jgi:hypothetical protein